MPAPKEFDDFFFIFNIFVYPECYPYILLFDFIRYIKTKQNKLKKKYPNHSIIETLKKKKEQT